MGVGEIGIEPDGLAVSGESGIHFSSGAEDVAGVAIGHWRAGHQLSVAFAGGEGFIQAPEACKGYGELAVDLGIVGVDFQRCPRCVDGFGKPAELGENPGEVMEAFKEIRLDFERLLKGLDSAFEPPCC